MLTTIICTECNGTGCTPVRRSSLVEEVCKSCNGKGVLGSMIIDDIAIAVNEEMIYITKKEYEELLEYKCMYEGLCK